MILDNGKDSHLKYLAGLSGGYAITQIGVSNNSTAVAAGDTTLGGTEIYKTLAATYVRPTLYMSASLAYGDGPDPFVLNKIGLKDSNGTLVQAKIVTSPPSKTATQTAIIEVQYSL